MAQTESVSHIAVANISSCLPREGQAHADAVGQAAALFFFKNILEKPGMPGIFQSSEAQAGVKWRVPGHVGKRCQIECGHLALPHAPATLAKSAAPMPLRMWSGVHVNLGQQGDMVNQPHIGVATGLPACSRAAQRRPF